MAFNSKCLWLLVVYFVLTANGFAREEQKALVEGPILLLPSVNAVQRYDDNIFSSAQGEQNSFVQVVNLALTTLIESNSNEFELGYNFEAAFYRDSSADDYFDHFLLGDAKYIVNEEGLLHLRVNYAKTHEDRGTGLSQGFDPLLDLELDAPDKYRSFVLLANYEYGTRDSLGQVVFNLDLRDKKYINHLEQTNSNDRQNVHGTVSFYYQVAPATRLLLETSVNVTDYANERPASPSLNNRSLNYLLGATWDNTEIVTTKVKIGYLEKTFAHRQRDQFSAFSWQAEIHLSPLSYSHFNLKTDRYDEETNGGGDFIDVKQVSFDWTHQWREQFETLLGVLYKNEEYKNANRDERYAQINLELRYHASPWLTLTFDVKEANQDSNLDRLEFDRSIYSLEAKVTI